MFVEASTRLVFGREIYGSKLARSEKAKVISAFWPVNIPICIDCSKLSIGEVQYFFHHSVSCFQGNEKYTYAHTFAYMKNGLAHVL